MKFSFNVQYNHCICCEILLNLFSFCRVNRKLCNKISLVIFRAVRTQMFTAANGDRQPVANVLVVFTDGMSNDPNSTWQEAMLTRAANISIIAVSYRCFSVGWEI